MRLFRCPSLDEGIRFVRELPLEELRDALDEQVQSGSLGALILCAESPALQALREEISLEALRHLVGAVEVNLFDVNESDLVAYVKHFLRPRRGGVGSAA